MRNGSQESYHYIMLKIINPYKNEVLTTSDVRGTADSSGKVQEEKAPAMLFAISTDKKRYMARENMVLKVEGNMKHDYPMLICLAVVPEMTDETPITSGKTAKASYGEIQYYPETRGISISGRLLETESGLPVPNALVNLSIIGNKDAMAIRTNEAGRFYFSLPGYTGSRDIFLCGEDIPGKATEVFIDNDFCSKPIKLPAPEFYLTDKEKQTAYKLAVNQKITSVYLADTLTGVSSRPQNDIPFYGEPFEILVMDKYIDLPTIEDYFQELVGTVNVRKFQGRKLFRFNSTRTEMTIYDPLVLIDWVAVNDIEKILAMSPRLIDRIELVNEPYVKGNITYGGIISFISKKSDFAGIDLPASGTFINYKFLEACSGEIRAGQSAGHLPDSRNTIFWVPEVRTDDKGSAEYSFTAPDTPGNYIVVLRGMNKSGEVILVKEEIEVIPD
jgi:hypothetical protein